MLKILSKKLNVLHTMRKHFIEYLPIPPNSRKCGSCPRDLLRKRCSRIGALQFARVEFYENLTEQRVCSVAYHLIDVA